MKFLFDLGGVFFDWDPNYYFGKVFKDYQELKYFLNEIEYAGCGTFTDVKNVFHYWPEAYYKKAIEISNL